MVQPLLFALQRTQARQPDSHRTSIGSSGGDLDRGQTDKRKSSGALPTSVASGFRWLSASTGGGPGPLLSLDEDIDILAGDGIAAGANHVRRGANAGGLIAGA